MAPLGIVWPECDRVIGVGQRQRRRHPTVRQETNYSALSASRKRTLPFDWSARILAIHQARTSLLYKDASLQASAHRRRCLSFYLFSPSDGRRLPREARSACQYSLAAPGREKEGATVALQEVALQSEARGGGAGGDPQLAQDGRDMVVDSARTDDHLCGDLRVGPAQRQQAQRLKLTPR